MRLFDEAAARAFLDTHWQREPVFLRAGLDDLPEPVDWQALVQDDGVESRRVSQTADDAFRLEHGPFDVAALLAEQSVPWTVLIQDADQYAPVLQEFLAAFDFLPRWRLEDIMVSYAADGGSVGPHVDQYDVFLIQADGQRHWTVGDASAAVSRDDEDGLRLVAPFEPSLDVIASPGDVLYLPPGVPHHGVARGPCLTYSVGFRAPAAAELAAALLDDPGSSGRYRDPGIAPAHNPALIDRHAIARTLDLLHETLDLDEEAAARCLGRLATETKAWLCPEPPESDVTPDALGRRLGAGRTAIVCATATRMAFSERPDLLFVNGDTLPLCHATAPVIKELAGQRRLSAGVLKSAAQEPALLVLLSELLNLGAVDCHHEP